MTASHNLCNVAFATSEFWVSFVSRRETVYLDDMINISSLIWAAGELLRKQTYQLLSTVSDELVAVDSRNESCDHCLYSW